MRLVLLGNQLRDPTQQENQPKKKRLVSAALGGFFTVNR